MNLIKQSDGPALARALIQISLIVGMMIYIGLALPLWVLFLLPLGILQVFLFTLLHETVHQTPFKTPFLNRVFGRITSFILFVPMNWFTSFHLAHHRYTNDPKNDPELSTPKPETMREYIWHLSGIMVWVGAVQTLWTNARGNHQSYIPKSAYRKIQIEAWCQIAFYAGLVLVVPLKILLLTWIIPLILGQPFLRLYLLAEHGRCPPVANMFENTRTTYTSRAIRWLAWNMPYHAEHHAYPSVPFHNLPALHEKSATYLISTSESYTAFHRDYAKGVNEPC